MNRIDRYLGHIRESRLLVVVKEFKAREVHKEGVVALKVGELIEIKEGNRVILGEVQSGKHTGKEIWVDDVQNVAKCIKGRNRDTGKVGFFVGESYGQAVYFVLERNVGKRKNEHFDFVRMKYEFYTVLDV